MKFANMRLVNILSLSAPIIVIITALGSIQAEQPPSDKIRTFAVDYTNNRFLKDNEPFRFIAGSFHYFRALPETWRIKLRTMRAAGLNAVTTYIEWSLHNPRDGVYIWDGIGDIERFIQLAADEDLYVILRPGPYICAERDNGGIPYWLFTKYPNIKMRTIDSNYLKEAQIWYGELMPRMEKYFYGNGGPIILVQVENEYGAYDCDTSFRALMRDETAKYVADNAVLFTNDIPNTVECGKIPNVLATLDFGKGNRSFVTKQWEMLRKVQPAGPLVNAEFYPGWFTHWQEPNSIVDTSTFIDTFRHILDDGASVNFYMFFGGTNFGFTAGANAFGPGGFQADITSYDYDAPMAENGEFGDKYKRIRDVIKDYLPLPNISIPELGQKMTLDSIKLSPKIVLLSPMGRNIFGRVPIESDKPLTFETLDQFSGFVLYETKLPALRVDPSVLKINGLRDRAIVLIDNQLIGVLSRENLADTLPISLGVGEILQILVENQGRINFKIADDVKGIIGDVQLNNVTLKNWTNTGFPLDFTEYQLDNLVGQQNIVRSDGDTKIADFLWNGPVIYHGTFNVEQKNISDTYINTSGWGKGQLFINGFNLGRYWPLAGPQMTLYVPKEILLKNNNSIIVLELQRAPKNGHIQFSDTAIFTPNANVP